MQTLHGSRLWTQHETRYWGYYRDALELLLSESASRGHGGTIVLLRVGSNFVSKEPIQAIFSLTDWKPLSRYVERLIKISDERHDDTMLLTVAFEGVMRRQLERLAQLSTIDGALILTSDLDPVAFGAKLIAPPWDGTVLLGPDGYGNNSGDIFDARAYGTRHSSAIAFAAASIGSTVFVVSQDGSIRAFRRPDEDTGAVLCWPDCTLSMSV